jgi:hypothetical protein
MSHELPAVLALIWRRSTTGWRLYSGKRCFGEVVQRACKAYLSGLRAKRCGELRCVSLDPILDPNPYALPG